MKEDGHGRGRMGTDIRQSGRCRYSKVLAIRVVSPQGEVATGREHEDGFWEVVMLCFLIGL